MHNTPTGPAGTAMMMPTSTPFTSSHNSIRARTHRRSGRQSRLTPRTAQPEMRRARLAPEAILTKPGYPKAAPYIRPESGYSGDNPPRREAGHERHRDGRRL